MSITAVGITETLDGPLPRPPEYSLLSVPGVLQESEGRWINGVNLYGYPVDTPSLWEPCSSGTFRDKTETSDWDQPRFDPFVAYLPIQCSTISGDPSDLADRAELVLNAVISFAVEQALSQGVLQSNNPFFGDTNLTQLGGAAVSADTALSFLENAIGATGRSGIIHATPGIASQWGFDKLRTNALAETAVGTPVAIGGGYIGADPVGKTGSTPESGVEWAFATGPVRVYLAPSETMRVFEYVDRETNVVTYRAERYVLAIWDTSLQSGVLVDWTP